MSIDLISKHDFESTLSVYTEREVFSSSFIREGERLFLRMELITEENEKCWRQFKNATGWVANNNDRGVLSVLVQCAGKPNCPTYEDAKEITGFTNEEYTNFIEKSINLKNKTQNKIVHLLEANYAGSGHMHINAESGAQYVVYITKNRNFSILNANKIFQKFTLKNFIHAYSDILISVGSDFSKRNSFHTRGISRNPYWVFEEKYAGLSMLLFSFPGVVAEKYFPEKNEARVKPLGAMQCNIIKHLLPGEGYALQNNKEIDITNLKVAKDDPEGTMNTIKISALSRIYRNIIGQCH